MMLLRSPYLSRKPAIFKTMTGLTVALFEDLVWDVRPALAQTRYAAQDHPGRQRAVDGGRHCRLPEREEILLTVIWLRHYFTQEALGYFFGVSDSTAKRAIERVLPVLERMGRDTMRQPPPSRRQRDGVAEARHAYPELADLDDETRVVDSFEQRVQRPRRGTTGRRIGTMRARRRRTRSRHRWWSPWATGMCAGSRPACRGRWPTPRCCASGVLERATPDDPLMGDQAYRAVDNVVTPCRKPRGADL